MSSSDTQRDVSYQQADKGTTQIPLTASQAALLSLLVMVYTSSEGDSSLLRETWGILNFSEAILSSLNLSCLSQALLKATYAHFQVYVYILELCWYIFT